MKLQHITALAFFCVTAGFSQIPLNLTPSRVIGHAQVTLTTVNPNLVEGRELYSPQGIALDTDATPPILYVADTGNSRVLAWKNAAKFANGDPADLVIGQKDRYSTLPQGPSTTFSVGLSSPTGLAVRAGALYVVDSGNNRILRFPSPFSQTDVFPDLVIGQPNFTSRNPNYAGQVNDKGLFLAANNQLFRGDLSFDANGRLWATDPGNRRVLRFPAFTAQTGNLPAADLEIGQLDFTSVQPALPAGQLTSVQTKSRINLPASVSFDAQGNLYIADRDLNRVLVFRTPFASGMEASRIMGVVIPAAPGEPVIPQSTVDRTAFLGPQDVVPLPGNAGIAVLDTGSHRMLIFDPLSLWPAEETTYSPLAKTVVGHSDFNNRLANNGDPAPSGLTFSLPLTAVLFNSELYLSDAGNNRVLVLPFDGATFQAAARVLGQDRMDTNSINLTEGREFQFVGGATRVGDAGLLVDSRTDPPHLYVADPFNNRILGFRDLRKVKPGDKADIVIGQPDFATAMCNYPNNDQDKPTQSSLCHPVGITLDGDGNLYVADSGNGRVLRFPDPFARGGTLPQADLVLGQSNFTAKITDPTPRTMAAPYGIAFAGDNGLLVSDQQHNRVLFFPRINGTFSNGQSATKVIGQPDYSTVSPGTTDNRMRGPQHIATDTDSRTYIADAGNNRVLIFDQILNLPGADARPGFTLSPLNNPTGVYVSPRTGEIWVANTGNSTALRYLRFDQLQLNSTPTLTVPSVQPLAISQDQYGDLFIADATNRVAIYYPGIQALNGATFLEKQPIAPGMITTLKPVGQQFGSETANFLDLPNPVPLPLQLADIQVLVNDNPAPLFYVSPGQINFQMPMSAPGSGTADVTVLRRSTGQILGVSPVQMNVVSPGIFVSGQGNLRQAAVINEDGSINSPTNPAARGSIISIYATGQGVVANPPPDGSPATGLTPTPEKPRVFIEPCFTDDLGCTTDKDDGILYSGLAPGQVGIWQINVRVPTATAPGAQRFLFLLYKSIASQDPTAFRAVFAVKDPK